MSYKLSLRIGVIIFHHFLKPPYFESFETNKTKNQIKDMMSEIILRFKNSI